MSLLVSESCGGFATLVLVCWDLIKVYQLLLQGLLNIFQPVSQENNLNLLEDGAVACSTENLDAVSSPAEDLG